MKIITFILSFAFTFSFPAHCPVYSCDNNTLTGKNCAKINFERENVGITLKGCEGDLVCDVSPFNLQETSCSPYYTTTKFYPGEYCRNETECYSGNCKNGKCEGKKESQNCTKDIDCDPGLYCLGKFCKKAIVNNTCGKDEKCAANYVKNESRCVKIGSIDNDQPASVPGACSSLYINSKGLCSKGPKLRENKFNSNSNKCEYEVDEIVIEDDPVCGMGENGESYCNPGVGNIDSASVLLGILV